MVFKIKNSGLFEIVNQALPKNGTIHWHLSHEDYWEINIMKYK